MWSHDIARAGFGRSRSAGVRLGGRDDTKLDEAIVRAAREAAGEDNRLFVDAGASDAHWPQGLKWAMRTAEMLKDYDVGWFEEPLRPDAIDDFCDLRRVSPVPIAGGEVLTRRQSFLPWLSRGAFDIVQPDVTKVGGISEQRRIAWMADDFGVQYVGHGWNTALGVAADLQLAAALPNVDLVEFIGGSAYVDGITETPFVLDAEGYLAIPHAPGARRAARSRAPRAGDARPWRTVCCLKRLQRGRRPFSAMASTGNQTRAGRRSDLRDSATGKCGAPDTSVNSRICAGARRLGPRRRAGGEGLFERVVRDCGNRHRTQRSRVGLPNSVPSNYLTLL